MKIRTVPGEKLVFRLRIGDTGVKIQKSTLPQFCFQRLIQTASQPVFAGGAVKVDREFAGQTDMLSEDWTIVE